MPARRILNWFDPRGRLSRSGYAKVVIRLALLSAGLLSLAIVLADQGLRRCALAVAAGMVVLAVAAFVQTVRRLHDRGRTGLWLALMVLITALNFLPIENLADDYPVPVLAYALASAGLSIWILFETLGLPGVPGSNRYGSSPSEQLA